ncbi:GNAT family N-acetyltransferase [Microbacterium sp. 2MCAF23]|uniref:GNAT family N-acetyltransferase n=1 Tax=Microbacterium sp. 2MCAF23 TaxID=3232985 RepID=UPI003F94CFA8
MTSPGITWPRPAGPLELRLPTTEALDRVLAWRNLPDVTNWLIRTQVDTEAFRRTWLDGIADPDDHSAIAFLGDEVVGTVSLWRTDAMGQSHVPEGPWRNAQAGIGYTIDPAHAGHGYATAVGGALLSLAFDELGVHRVTAGCFADNIASWRVMEKLGMRREQHGIRDSWHAERGWIDGFTYAILADEWRAQQS